MALDSSCCFLASRICLLCTIRHVLGTLTIDMNIWIISDTHWNHERIKQLENRPDEFNQEIIINWQSVVAQEDLVLHLGDVIFGMEKDTNLPEIMKQLPGRKVLCRGNHDPRSWTWYMDRGFDMVQDVVQYKNIAFSHAPLTPLPHKTLFGYQNEIDLNIHGHFHRMMQRGGEKDANLDPYYDYEYYRENIKRYKLVQIEDELRPFSLEEVLAGTGIMLDK